MNLIQVMNDRRNQPNYVKPASLNEVERKREVDRVNFENNLMLSRLNKSGPTLSLEKLEADFEKHLHASANLRRKQMKPLALPRDMMHRVNEKSSLFDSATYQSQHDSFGGSGSIGVLQSEFGESPIKSMKEFRQHVIATKKLAGLTHNHHGSTGGGSLSPSSAAGMVSGGADTLLRSQREVSVHRNEALFELSHNPGGM